jgi:hypothetical protein
MNHLTHDISWSTNGFEIQRRAPAADAWSYHTGWIHEDEAIAAADRLASSHGQFDFVRVVCRRTGKVVAGWYQGKRVRL